MRKSEEIKKNRILMLHHDMHAFQIRMSCASQELHNEIIFAKGCGRFGQSWKTCEILALAWISAERLKEPPAEVLLKSVFWKTTQNDLNPWTKK